jgi:NAD(P)-dependent dehydrogenase (short-subunit alcohol dehydrogenase family)
MDPFRDRVAVITGGGGGIAAGLGRAFAARGARLVLADIELSAAEAVAHEIEAAGGEAHAVECDVTKPESVEALADAARDRFGAVHIVCNNAGVATAGEMAKAPLDEWRFVMDVNFWGVVHGVHTFAPRLVEQGQGGNILNTASMAGLVGMSWLGIYCASKYAVMGLTESLARELRPAGIGVHALCPMIVDTKINTNSARARARRAGEPEPDALPEVADAAAADMKGGVISPDEVAARVVRGIERGDLYILTHPEQREFIRRRSHKIDAMFDEANWPL